MPTRRVDNVRHAGHDLRKLRVRFERPLPDAERVGRQINLVVGLIVEDTCGLVVKTAQQVVALVVLEKDLVGADHLAVFSQARPHPVAQVNDLVNSFSRKERSAYDLLRLLADTVHTARALN